MLPATCLTHVFVEKMLNQARVVLLAAAGPGASSYPVAGSDLLPANSVGKAGRVPVSAPSRWLLLPKSMWPLYVSGQAFGVTVLEIHLGHLCLEMD